MVLVRRKRDEVKAERRRCGTMEGHRRFARLDPEYRYRRHAANFPAVSCMNGPNGDMFMNYLDYTDDAGMNTFTSGQSVRMDATLHTARASILASDGLVPPGPPNLPLVGGERLRKRPGERFALLRSPALDSTPVVPAVHSV